MSESVNKPVDKLQKHRFVIDKPSMDLMKYLREKLPQLDQEFGIKGLAFFGSRTKSTNREDSDLDVIIFYDGSDFGPEIRTREQELAAGIIIDKEKGDIIFSAKKADAAIARTEARYKFETEIRKKLLELLTQRMGLSNERAEKQLGSIIPVDISKEATDDALKEFYENAIIIEQLNFNEKHGVYLQFLRLLNRFFLGIATSLYANRQYILDQLAQIPDGERLFIKY
jgi:predicted nucleotidyltransferase